MVETRSRAAKRLYEIREEPEVVQERREVAVEVMRPTRNHKATPVAMVGPTVGKAEEEMRPTRCHKATPVAALKKSRQVQIEDDRLLMKPTQCHKATPVATRPRRQTALKEAPQPTARIARQPQAKTLKAPKSLREQTKTLQLK